MELLVAVGVGVLVFVGVYLVLRPRTFSVVLGYVVISYAVNLFLFGSGRLGDREAPIVDERVVESYAAEGGAVGARLLERYMDPLPQALVLTAIVIGLGMMAILLVLALRVYQELGVDHVEGIGSKLADEPEGGES